jgi:hypothetical protein
MEAALKHDRFVMDDLIDGMIALAESPKTSGLTITWEKQCLSWQCSKHKPIQKWCVSTLRALSTNEDRIFQRLKKYWMDTKSYL